MPAPMPAPSSVPALAERGTAKHNKMIAALNAECMTDLFFLNGRQWNNALQSKAYGPLAGRLLRSRSKGGLQHLR